MLLNDGMICIPRRLHRLRHHILVCSPWLSMVSCLIECSSSCWKRKLTRNVLRGRAGSAWATTPCVSRELWTYLTLPFHEWQIHKSTIQCDLCPRKTHINEYSASTTDEPHCSKCSLTVPPSERDQRQTCEQYETIETRMYADSQSKCKSLLYIYIYTSRDMIPKTRSPWQRHANAHL